MAGWVINAFLLLMANAWFFACGWLIGVNMTHEWYRKQKKKYPND